MESETLTCNFRRLTLTWTQHSQRACSLVLFRVKLQHVDLLWVTSRCFTHRAAGADEETVSSCYVKCVICNVCYSLKNKYVMSETVWGSCLSSPHAPCSRCRLTPGFTCSHGDSTYSCVLSVFTSGALDVETTWRRQRKMCCVTADSVNNNNNNMFAVQWRGCPPTPVAAPVSPASPKTSYIPVGQWWEQKF